MGRIRYLLELDTAGEAEAARLGPEMATALAQLEGWINAREAELTGALPQWGISEVKGAAEGAGRYQELILFKEAFRKITFGRRPV